MLIQNTAPNHLFEENYDPTIVNATLAYRSWTMQQHIHVHTASPDPLVWHPIGQPALEVYLHKHATMGANEPCIPHSPTQPHSATKDDPPLRDQDPQTQSDTLPVATVEHAPRYVTRHHILDNCQLPRWGNHTRRTAPTWKLPTGTMQWKEILPGVTAIETIHLVTPDQIQLPPSPYLSIPAQGTATIQGTTIEEDNQLPQARPTQAVWVTATTNNDITKPPDCGEPPSTVPRHVLTTTQRRKTGRRGETTSPSTTHSSNRRSNARGAPARYATAPPNTQSGTTQSPYTQKRYPRSKRHTPCNSWTLTTPTNLGLSSRTGIS